MSIYDVYPNDLIEKVAEELKNIDSVKPLVWTGFVKTGAHKERAPANNGWWYIRAAAILRSVCILGPVGVSKLRTKYGGRKRRGHKPPKFRKGSGSIIRKIFQQLEKAGLIKFAEKGVHKGRVITPKGQSLLDKAAIELIKKKPKVEKKISEPKVEKKEVKVEKKEVKVEKKEVKVEKKEVKVEKKEVKVEPDKIPTAEDLVEQTKKKFKDGEKIKSTAEDLIKEA